MIKIYWYFTINMRFALKILSNIELKMGLFGRGVSFNNWVNTQNGNWSITIWTNWYLKYQNGQFGIYSSPLLPNLVLLSKIQLSWFNYRGNFIFLLLYISKIHLLRIQIFYVIIKTPFCIVLIYFDYTNNS